MVVMVNVKFRNWVTQSAFWSLHLVIVETMPSSVPIVEAHRAVRSPNESQLQGRIVHRPNILAARKDTNGERSRSSDSLHCSRHQLTLSTTVYDTSSRDSRRPTSLPDTLTDIRTAWDPLPTSPYRTQFTQLHPLTVHDRNTVLPRTTPSGQRDKIRLLKQSPQRVIYVIYGN